MELCKFNGVSWDNCEAKELGYVYCHKYDFKAFPYILDSLEDIAGITKVVEDVFDEQGRPRVKIIYQDAGDWSPEFSATNEHHAFMITRAEQQKVHDMEARGENFEPPRLIFIAQDKDYWPGSESDPNAMKRRIWKERAYVEGSTNGRRPDLKIPSIAYYDGHQFVEDRCLRLKPWLYNPNVTSLKFIFENIRNFDPLCLKVLQKILLLSEAIGREAVELEDLAMSESFEKVKIQEEDPLVGERELQCVHDEEIDALVVDLVAPS